MESIPIGGPGAARQEILYDVASIQRTEGMGVVSHWNVQRVLDIYGAVQDRDLGAVASRPITKAGLRRTLRLFAGTVTAARDVTRQQADRRTAATGRQSGKSLCFFAGVSSVLARGNST